MLDVISAAAGIVRNHYLELANQTPYYRAANHCSDKDRNIESTPPVVDTYEPTAVAPTEVTLVAATDDGEIIEREITPDEHADVIPEENSEEAIEVTYRFRHHTYHNHEVRLNFALQALAHSSQPVDDVNSSSAADQPRSGRA
jgi:hypothetical protein